MAELAPETARAGSWSDSPSCLSRPWRSSCALLLLHDIWLWVAFVGWAVAGLGIGLGYPTAVSIAFAHAEPGTGGTVASAMLLLDLFAFSVGVGIGGVLLALSEASGWSTETGTAMAMGLGVAMVVGAVGAASRSAASRPVRDARFEVQRGTGIELRLGWPSSSRTASTTSSIPLGNGTPWSCSSAR